MSAMTILPIKSRASPPPVYSVQPHAQHAAFDDDEAQSPIHLRINTSVRVNSNNNVVCMRDTPAEHANAIARAVVRALQENSSGQCGIPMIDEDGRPRPVKIEVDAGMDVLGADNVVGNESFVRHVFTSNLRRKRRDEEEDEDEDEAAEACASKRRKSD
ncbi:hypothetical protein AAL_00496 [Moelleriella libera RCEF 2490]|uniref:Uncharacterized protein n=1 Tax=Moelleriella libera RCEF 2490 TaxID=1081109 RepID=A0A166UW13_9HYPO|nr:hypothetical protein AAL_00496 [Moelleriella libera RCEF 2490]